MSDSVSPTPSAKTHAEIIAEICATPDHKVWAALQARIEAVPEDDRYLKYELMKAVSSWLESQRRRSDDVEANFWHAADDLVRLAAFVLRALQQRLGDDLSPTLFASHCYGAAERILQRPDFKTVASDAFEFAFDPRRPPSPEEVARKQKANKLLEDAIAPMIIDYLGSQSEPVRTGAIERHIELLPLPDCGQYPIGTHTRHALKTLVKEGAVRGAKGLYSLTTGGTGDVRAPAALATAAEVEKPELLQIEETLGEGREQLYVYFNEAERALAKHEGRDWWPCKIGFTTGHLSARVLQQRPATSMTKLPVVGLVIKTDDARSLERAVHAALDAANARVEAAIGREWFATSPAKIKDWFTAQQQTVAALKYRKA